MRPDVASQKQPAVKTTTPIVTSVFFRDRATGTPAAALRGTSAGAGLSERNSASAAPSQFTGAIGGALSGSGSSVWCVDISFGRDVQTSRLLLIKTQTP